MKKLWILGLGALLFLASCKKNEEEKMNINSQLLFPEDNSTVYFNDPVRIRAMIEDPVEVHTYTIEVKIMPQDSTVFYVFAHDHAQKLQIDTTWTNRVNFDSDMRLYLIAYNHENQVDSTVINFFSKFSR